MPTLGAYADGELTGADRTWWERHLRACGECREEVRRIRDLGTTLRQNLPIIEPSAALREAVRRAAQTPGPAAGVRRAAGRPWLARWPSAIAALLLLGVGFGVGRVVDSRRAPTSVVDQVVAAHVRSLQADHLVDVASSSRHVVKPWFEGRLDFAPPVPDLVASGYPLIGGRTEYLNERVAAGLVYSLGRHRINVFLWPADRAGPCRLDPPRMKHGYNLVHGEIAGMELWAISDGGGQDLEKFVATWQSTVAAATGVCRPS
jgi:anti-sigma factor RsiW